MEARWQGEKRTLTIPQRKAPTAAMANPPVIHWFMVMNN
jgi:hypothetical protein